MELWDKAIWRGVGVWYSSRINRLCLLLDFTNEEFGDQIFKDWIKELGNEDINYRIRISLIEGVFPDGIRGYYTLVGSDIDDLVRRSHEQGHDKDEVLFTYLQRIHRIEPNDNFRNYDKFKRKFKEIGEYYLCPTCLNSKGRFVQTLNLVF